MTATLRRAKAAVDELDVPPHSIEAECSVLGALLLSNAAFDTVQEIVGPQDFYRRENREIYAAISELLGAGKEADVIIVYERLVAAGLADELGGLAYLNELAQYVPSAGNVRRYSEIVRDHAVRRRLIAAGDRISTLPRSAESSKLSTQELIDSAQAEIMALADTARAEGRTSDHIGALMVKLLERVQVAADNPDAARGVLSGLDDLDRLTGGLRAGDLVILAARPSMGKTSLALNVAEHAAFVAKLPTLVVSLEMSSDDLTLRMTGSICRIDQARMRNGDLTPSEWSRLGEAPARMDGPLEFADDPGLVNVLQIRSLARQKVRQYGSLGLIVVDYLQLMSGQPDGNENRASELGEVSRGLKLLAKELGCPVIALSQLNRGVEGRPDKRPMLSDLRESGAIEQDADIIMFIYRDEYYTKDACKEPGVAEIIVAKQRNGPTGTAKVAWEGRFTRFENLTGA